MVLPAEFNDVEHFQSVCRSHVNKLVRADFKDLGGDDWEPTIGTSRGSMRQALTHKDSDSLIMTESRLLLYYLVYGKCKSLQADIFGEPKHVIDVERKYKPHIHLCFSLDSQDVDAGENKVEGKISFRLMNESSTTITQAEINKFAAKIKSIFAVPVKYIWNKGKIYVVYTEKEKGYQLQLLVNNKTEAKEIISKVLDIQSHTPDWGKMTTDENESPVATYPDNPGSEIILGETHKKPRRRPIENVKFRYATLTLHNKKRGITLVDTTNRRKNAIERV